MIRKVRLIFPFLIAAAIFVTQSPAYSQEPMARVGSFVGEVFVRSQVTAPPGEWRRLTAAPANLFNGDEVRTERGRAEIIYPNDDAVRILENSTARLTISQEPRRRLLFFRRLVNLRGVATTAGKMWANVKVDRNNEMEFRSPVAVASVRGTILEFHYYPGPGVAYLGVALGRALLTAQGVGVNVGANNAATAARGQPPSLPFPYTPAPPPAISETAMAAALAAPPAPPVPAPPAPVAPPAPAPVAVAMAPAITGGGGGGAITTAPAPAPAPTGVPAYGTLISSTFPSGLQQDDNDVNIPFTGGFTFPFYGTTYTSAWVGTNGYITFCGPSCFGNDGDYRMSIENLFRGEASPTAKPAIATFEGDRYPPDGTVNVTQFNNSFVVTFKDVPDYSGPGINTFRTSLFSNGQIMMEYNMPNTLSGDGVPQIGISPGGPDARLNPVSFSSGNITSRFGPLDAIFQTFNNPAGDDGEPRMISHATLTHLSGPSAPGFRTTTIVQNYITGTPTFTDNNYLGSSPVTGNPFTLSIGSSSFSLNYTSTSQSGPSTFTPITANTGTWSITSITSDTIAAGEFKFAAGQNISVAITDRPILDLLNATLIFTPNAAGGYDMAFFPTAPVIAASPST